MKPVSLADISYSQALQILGMRKEALDSGEIQRLPRHLLEDSYYFRDAGQYLQEKQSFDWKKTLSDVWKNPTGKATLIGAGLGGAAGLGKTFMDEEDDSYLGNALTGALGGGALGLGGGLVFDSKTRNSLIDKFNAKMNSGGGPPDNKNPGGNKPVDPVQTRVEQAMASGNPEQEYVNMGDEENWANIGNVASRTAQIGTIGAAPTVAAYKMKPGMGTARPLHTAANNPAAMDWETFGKQLDNTPTGTRLVNEAMPEGKTLYGINKQEIPKPKPTPPPKPKPKPKQNPLQSLISSAEAELPPPKPNLSPDMQNHIDAQRRSIPQPTSAADAGRQAARAKPPVSPITQVSPEDVLKQNPEFIRYRDLLKKVNPNLSDPSTKAVLLFQAMTDPNTNPATIAKIEKELGLNAGMFTGRAKDPALLKALANPDYTGKGGIGDPSRLGVGTAVGEAFERKSAQPLKDVVRRIPKGKVAAIMGLLGVGYGASSRFGINDIAAEQANKLNDIREARRLLQEAISAQAAKGGN